MLITITIYKTVLLQSVGLTYGYTLKYSNYYYYI